jgi:hypothetical protein
MAKVLRNLSLLYVILAILVIVIDVILGNTSIYQDKTSSCNFYDSMLFGIECRNFTGSNLVETILNWPFWFIYAPFLAFVSFLGLFLTILIWAPIIFLCWTYFKGKNNNEKLKGRRFKIRKLN